MQSLYDRQREAWEGWVGDQSPAEFLRISRQKGLTTPEAAVAAYLEDWPHDGDVPEGAYDLLLGYIQRCG